MIIYYAIGGGLGHLTRAKKILQYKNISNFKVITALPNNPVFSPDKILQISVDLHHSPEKINTLISNAIIKYQANNFFVDTFPFGILGELNIEKLNKLCEVYYVARYIKWDKYQHKIKFKGKFDACLLFDMTDPQQKIFINANSHYIEKIKLPILKFSKKINLQYPFYWLINHSGNKEEVLELFSYAQELALLENVKPHFIINTQCDIGKAINNNVSIFNIYPATFLYEKAAKIISACGFNVMQETVAYHEKHLFIPFSRKYDDQFKRAQYRNKQFE